jgi:hypothetical protein
MPQIGQTVSVINMFMVITSLHFSFRMLCFIYSRVTCVNFMIVTLRRLDSSFVKFTKKKRNFFFFFFFFFCNRGGS